MDLSKEKARPIDQIFTVRHIEGGKTSPEFKKKLASLYSYLAKHLAIREAPKVIITKNEKNSKESFGLTAYYDHIKKTIRLYITGRHDTDILRSFAHEVVHHWQNERGTLQSKDKTIPITHDTKPHYAQNDWWLRKREMEAYLFGNILFRDWQDENRNGPPEQEPILPQPYD
jgi:hypothetical protein